MLNKDNIEEILKTLDPNDEAMIEAILEHLVLMGFPQDLLEALEELLKDGNHKDHNASKVLTVWLFQLANKRKLEKKKKNKKKKSPIPFFIYATQAGYFHSQKLALCQYDMMAFDPNSILLKACMEIAQNHISRTAHNYINPLQEFQSYTETSKLNTVLDSVGNDILKEAVQMSSTILGTALEGVTNQIAGMILCQIPAAIINTLFNIVGQSITSGQSKSPFQLF